MGARSGGNGKFTGTGGEVFYGGPGSKGWEKDVQAALASGVARIKDTVYIFDDLDNDVAYTVLAGVAAKSKGFQKDIATKGLKNMFDTGHAKLTEKQAWAVSYEFKNIFGKK